VLGLVRRFSRGRIVFVALTACQPEPLFVSTRVQMPVSPTA